MTRMSDSADSNKEICRNCGAPAFFLESPYGKGGRYLGLCSECMELEAQEREEQEREEERVARHRAILGSSNIPPLAKRCTFADSPVQDRTIREAVENWKYGPLGLYLYGPAGTGKTGLSWCLMDSQAQDLRSVLFISVPDLLGGLQSNFTSRGYQQAQDLVERGRSVGLLVLDDIGAEKTSEKSREVLLALVNHRINHELPIVFTSNLTPKELAERIGDPSGRLVDRIIGASEIRKVKGKSARVKAAEGRMDRRQQSAGGQLKAVK